MARGVVRSFNTDSSIYQPGIFPYAMTVMCSDDRILAHEPYINFMSFNAELAPDFSHKKDAFNKGYFHNTWTIGAKLLRYQTEVGERGQLFSKSQNLYMQENGKPYIEQMFSNLYRSESERIMCHLRDEVLFARMYKNPHKMDTYLQERLLFSKGRAVEPISLITTKPVMLPDDIERGYRAKDGDMKQFLYQNINPLIFTSHHFDEKNMGVMNNLARTDGNDFYPSQFIAVRQEGLLNLENKRFIFGDMAPEMLEYTSAESEVLFHGKYQASERWAIYAVSPYDLQTIVCFDDLDDTLRFMDQAEKHFIDPFYNYDRTAAFLDAKMDMVKDFRPSHHSKITGEHKAVLEARHIAHPN